MQELRRGVIEPKIAAHSGRLIKTTGDGFHAAFVNATDAIEAAVAESETATKRREFAELTVRREVASAYAQYDRAARAMEIFRVGVREPARANLDVIRQTYELGSKTLIDYIGEQRRFIELENDFIDAELAGYNARVGIARASASPELIKR